MPDQPIVAVYERVSTEQQDIARQESVREWAGEMFPESEIVVVPDDGVSAFKVSIFDRPGGKRLCEMIETGRVEAVCTDAQDRLSRGKQSEWWNFADLCEQNKTRIVIDRRELRFDEEGDEIKSALDAMIARRESHVKSHRVKGGLLKKARSGRRPCGTPPLGYRVVYGPTVNGKRPEGKLVMVESEAEIVRRVFSDYLSGMGQNAIARRLNKDGVRTRRGAKFATRVVSTMLRNPIYVGSFRMNGETFKLEDHETIIDIATWKQAQVLIAARTTSPGKGRGRPTTGRHLFVNGLLRCGICGCSMSPRRKPNGSEWYRCTKRHTYGPEACPMPDINRRRVDEQVLMTFEAVLLDAEGSIATVRSQGQREVDEAFAMADQNESQAALALERLTRVRRAFQDGKIKPEDWAEQRKQLEDEHEGAVAEAERHRNHAIALGAQVLALDADAEFQRTVVELREAVAGRIDGADGLGALRAALTGTFESVVLYRRDDKLCLLPYLRAEAIHPSALDPTSDEWDPYSAPARKTPLQIPGNDDGNKRAESEDDAMAITRDDVLHVARLARLELSDEEVERMREQLSAILEAVGKVAELDLSGVEPTAHPLDLVNVLADDEPRPSLSLEEALANAPDPEDGFFGVPAV